MKDKPGAIIIEGHVQGLSNTRALGINGIPVWVVDIDACLASQSKYCKRFVKCPPFDSEDLVEFLIKIGTDHDLRGWLLLPSNDHAVVTISRSKPKLEKIFKFLIPEFSLIEKIYNKEKLLKLATLLNVPIPKTWFKIDDVLNYTSFINYPVITRGKFGLTFYKIIRKKALISKNMVELKADLEKVALKIPQEHVFIQEMIPFNGSNKTVSFTAFCDHGIVQSFWMGVKLRDHPFSIGTATYSKSVNIPDLVEPSRLIVEKLNYTGVCEIEFLLDPKTNQYKLIEINARTWLWVGLARACGIDYAQMIYNHVNNIKQDFPKDYQTGLYWMHLYTDFFFSITSIIKGFYKVRDYIKSLSHPKIFAVFSTKDIKPFLFLTFSMIKYIRKR